MTFARTQPDGVWLGGGYVPTAADWSSLDAKIAAAVNGADGGTWSPSGPIVVDNLQITGRTLVAYGGELRAPVRLNGSSLPEFAAGHPYRERTIVTPLTSFQASPRALWTVNATSIGAQAIALIATLRDTKIDRMRLRAALRVHDGARLTRAVLTWRVPFQRSVPPVRPPRMRVVAMDVDGNVTPLASAASGADARGFLAVPTSSSAEQWFDGGAVRALVYPCEATIDIGRFAYFAEVEDETGSNALAYTAQVAAIADGTLVRQRQEDVYLAGTPAALSGVQTLNGVSTSAGYQGLRVLVYGMLDPTANGIWLVNNFGAWVRASDSYPAQLPRGSIVLVLDGSGSAATNNRGRFFECVLSAEFANTAAATVDIRQEWRPLEPDDYTGNIYHAVALKFDGLSGHGWQ